MTRGARSTVALMVAAVLGLVGCTSSTTDRAGGRGLQAVTVLEIAQLDDAAPSQVQAYATEVEKESHGSLRLHFNDFWHKGEVDFEKHTLEDVTGGRMPGAWVGVRSLDLVGVTSFQPLVAPLLVDSQAMQDRIFSAGIPLEMARGLEGHGLVAVAVLPGPMRKVLGVRKPFREPEDFRRALLGIQGGEIPESTAKALGATFTRMPSGARLSAVDAYEQQVDNIFGSFYGLAAKYVTANINLWPQAMAVILNQAAYRELTDTQREILRKAAGDAIPAALKATQSEDDAGVAKLCGQDVAFPTSSDLQLAALRRAVQPVYDEIARDPDNARMLNRLTTLRAAVAAPPDVSACTRPGPGAHSGSLPEGTYDMVLENDARSQCTDSPPQGTPGQKSWYSLEVRDGRVTIRQRIDNQSAPWGVGYYGFYSTLRDRIRIDSLNARWSFDGTALRLNDMTGGSCSDAVLWTTKPWVLRSGPVQGAPVVPDGTYEAGLTDADRHLCDGKPGGQGLNPQSDPRGKPTSFSSITLDAGALRGYAREGRPTVIPRLEWVGSYRVYGHTFELTTLTFVDGPEHWDRLTATFTFDGTNLTLKPVGTWPCWARVWWALHPWTLPKKTP
ncbi:TRAP-type C4-dicarboxylate transport system substrate-binding protein [Humibacillus xanthopallidus]|uniref:TRAP-type C4-dicarboxylate transport system substrate-binding protein n=1 Tax=Humibacillus xanthopallidus TaxID=412689 RepID=A0A543PM15_9MICO|nr:TRAP-type C4-dicarboxylate transport system substrate-binding protein [Humibacillus xanthopallidus]